MSTETGQLHRWMYNLSAITAPEASDMVMALGPVDIRRLLGSIRVPALLLHRSGDRRVEVHTSRYMAERIPGPGWWSCPATTTSRASATRSPCSP